MKMAKSTASQGKLKSYLFQLLLQDKKKSDYVTQVPKRNNFTAPFYQEKKEVNWSFSIQCWILSTCHHLCSSILMYTLREITETPSFTEPM